MTTLGSKLSAVPTLALSLLLASSLILTAPARSQAEKTCRDSSKAAFSQLAGDFVLETGGDSAGKAHIELLPGGCGLRATLTMEEGSSLSVVFVDPVDLLWHDLTIFEDGSVARAKGQPRIEAGLLRHLEVKGSLSASDRSSSAFRSQYQRMENGDLRQTAAVQQNQVWHQALDITYVPLAHGSNERTQERVTQQPTEDAAAQQSNDPAPTERSTAPSTKRAVASSGADQASPDAAELKISSEAKKKTPEMAVTGAGHRISRITLDSPVSVELPLGPIDRLPAGYSWRSADLAKYEIDNTTIETVEVSRRSKRGKTSMLVTFFGHSKSFTEEFEITVHLQGADGTVLSEATTKTLYTGRALGSQISEGVSSMTLEVATDTKTFNRAFAGEQRPSLAIRIVSKG